MEHFSELNRPIDLNFYCFASFRTHIVAIYCETIVEMRFIEASQLPIKLNRNENEWKGEREGDKEWKQ